MKESGIEISHDDSSSDPEQDVRRRSSSSSSVASTRSSPLIGKRSSRPRTPSLTPLTIRRPQRLRFQTRLMLLKQQQEQSQESQKASRKTAQSGPKSQSLTRLPERGRHHTQRRDSKKNGDQEQSSDLANSLTSPPEVRMKFNLIRARRSSNMGSSDDASPSSSTTSIPEMSETDQFLLGGVIEVKAVEELPEEISELLCHASYPDGICELVQSGNEEVSVETSSPSPSEIAAQPKYRGGRKKESRPQNMTPEQRVNWERERQKKDNHNHIERRRRDKINECIRLLSLIVPNGDDNIEYNKKGSVLEAAVSYIKRLQSEQKQMEDFQRQQEILQRANRSLVLEIQQLQNRAKQVHVSSSPHLSPPVVVQQVMLQQYQPQFERQPSLDQEHLQHADVHLGSVQLLMTTSQSQLPQIEIQQQQQQLGQQNPFLSEFVSFVQEPSSEFPHLVTGDCHFDSNQFETISESIFLDEPENNFQDLSLMDHDLIDINPDPAATINDYSVDDFFNVRSAHLNGDPLLSNATDEPMASDFDDLFIPLAL